MKPIFNFGQKEPHIEFVEIHPKELGDLHELVEEMHMVNIPVYDSF